MKFTKKQIEKMFHLKVIGLVGNKKFLTVHKKKYPLKNIEGIDVIDTCIYLGCVDIIDDKPKYTCENCTRYRYYVKEKKIEKQPLIVLKMIG